MNTSPINMHNRIIKRISDLQREEDRIHSFQALKAVRAMNPEERAGFLARFEEGYGDSINSEQSQHWGWPLLIIAIIWAVIYCLVMRF